VRPILEAIESHNAALLFAENKARCALERPGIVLEKLPEASPPFDARPEYAFLGCYIRIWAFVRLVLDDG
jgi:hypothetical protein